MKDPFSCPNSSLSIKSFGIAAILRAIKGFSDLALYLCKALATNSFPVPLSPYIITVRSFCDKRAIDLYNSCIEGDLPTINCFSDSFLNLVLFLEFCLLSNAFFTSF